MYERERERERERDDKTCSVNMLVDTVNFFVYFLFIDTIQAERSSPGYLSYRLALVKPIYLHILLNMPFNYQFICINVYLWFAGQFIYKRFLFR